MDQGFSFQPDLNGLEEPSSPKMVQSHSTSLNLIDATASAGESLQARDLPLVDPSSPGAPDLSSSELPSPTALPDPTAALSSSGAGRHGKVPLEKGFSQVDWLRYMNSSADLAALNGGIRRRIKMEDVKKHNSKEDCWTVLHGRVYFISPYLRYHPGGIAILMKAAGCDCTSLFNQYHAWVNFDFMLSKCLVGILDTDSS